MAFIIRCPHCRERIPWKKDVPFPDECPRCGVATAQGETDDTVIVMPAFLSARTKAIDGTYRQMESTSVVRAEMAAQQAGCDVSDMSALKITDMKDNMREGDIAAYERESDAAAARLKQASPAAIPHFETNGAEMSVGVSTGAVAINGQVQHGIYPRAGANTAAGIQRLMQR